MSSRFRVLSSRRARADFLVLLLILAVAACFRLYSVDWDANTHQHPDERFLTIVGTQLHMPSSLGEYFSTQTSPINPYAQGINQMAYGQLPVTLVRFIGERFGNTPFNQVPILGAIVSQPVPVLSFDGVPLLGRLLSALADLGSIVFTWLLARRIFGTRVAHLSALLLAFAVLDIQTSHFFTVDGFVQFFALGALFFGQRCWQKGSLRDAVWAGVLTGLAIACKISAAALLPVLFLVLAWPGRRRITRAGLLDKFTVCGVLLLGAFTAFRVAEPYAFLGPTAFNLKLNPEWFSDKAYWAKVSSGDVDVPYMIQWTGTLPYAFVLQQITLWGLGPAFALAAFLGIGLVAWRLIRGGVKERQAILILLWVGLNFVYFGGQFAKFLRYLLPIYGTLAIFAAYTVVTAVQASRRLSPAGLFGLLPRRAAPWLGTALAVVIVGGAALSALAFTSIYSEPISRVQASDWIYQNVPAGATLATEHWDDRLPLDLPGHASGQYTYQQLTLYDDENEAERTKLIQTLNSSDYIVMASRRLIGSIPRLPQRYPLAIAYYNDLQSGALGFTLVERMQVGPHLGPIGFDDSLAQEDFTVYDHPLVEVWQKNPTYSADTVQQLLGSLPLNISAAVRPVAASTATNKMMLTPAESQTVTAGGTWSRLFNPSDLANQLSIPVWLLAAEAIALAAVPLLWRTLRFLPDGGFGATKILGLACVAYVPWLVASLKIAPFGLPTLALAWLLLVALSALSLFRRRDAFVRFLRAERRLLLATEVVFLAGFALFLWIRAMNPDLWQASFGGEKPMNFAFLNAVVKSDYFPPYDPWFAGGVINYYYWGLVMVAALVKLTGIVPAVAFNLAEPTIYGAVCAVTFGLVFDLCQMARGRVGRLPSYVGAVSGVLLLAVLGNLDAGLQVMDRLDQLGGTLAPNANVVLRDMAGVVALVRGAAWPPLDFWRSTRFIGPEQVGPIHEFPYFTFLYGDLHAHELALPLTLAAITVGLSLMRSLRASPGRVPWAQLVWAGLLLGLLRMTNTWDLPTYAALTGACLLLGLLPSLVHGELRALRTLVVSGALLAVLSQLLIEPYLQRYELFYSGVDPFPANTALNQYLTIHGLLLFLPLSLFAWYFVQSRRRLGSEERTRALVPAPGYLSMAVPLDALWARGISTPASWASFAGAIVGLGFLAMGYATRGFIIMALGFAVAAGLAHWRQSSRSFQALLVAAALCATLLPEFVALQGDVGRMNTVFKFYFQAWALLSVAAGAAVAWLVRAVRRDTLLKRVLPAWGVVCTILVLSAVAYPLLASNSKISQRFESLPLTLDGMAYMHLAQYSDKGRDLDLPADWAAIKWIQENVQGTPVMLEGRTGVYLWGSRISIYTGLPTILGWDVHESQQRTADTSLIQQRAQDVDRAYNSPNPADALAILQRYNVRYVYVGGLERAYYQSAGLAKFSTMTELHLVYDTGPQGVQIYQVGE